MRLTAHGLGHAFDDGPWLFRNVDLELLPGHIYALTGPSGSGKSTLLGILAALVSPREGHIDRFDIGRVGWVFQNPHGVPGRTSRDHVALPLLARGDSIGDAEARADALLAQFAIDHLADRPFRSLSGGEAQRLMLARAVAAGPELLLIDEPTAQLDAQTAAIVSRSITATAGDDAIVVVATHDARTRDACTDHVDLAPAPDGHGIHSRSLR